MSTERMLVIDDDKVFRNSVTKIAEATDFEVMTTSDPAAARAIVAAWCPSVVVIDPFMSAADGIQLLRQLGAEGCSAQVILTSGLDPNALVVALEIAGEHGLKTAGVLAKPVRPQSFRDLLSQIIEAKALTLSELTRAITDGQLFLEYQPQLDCRSNHIKGVEALVRWRHPTRGVVTPDQFIGLAEENSLIDDLTDWVVSTAAKQVSVWHQAGMLLTLSVNISARNLNQNLPDRLAESCAAGGLKPDLVILEMAESTLMRDVSAMIHALGELRFKGFGISIDEFGTGYSSLIGLRCMPVTEVKIDRSLVSKMPHTNDCQMLVSVILDLARKLELQSVAVGVESETILWTLRALGCGLVQGYHIGRPAEPARIPAVVAGWSSRASSAVA